jgi:hypothetical protein
VVPREIEKKIKIYWDDSFYEIAWKGTSGEFWKDLREHVDSRLLRLRGKTGWVDPARANYGETYVVQRFADQRTLVEVEIRRGDTSIQLGTERTSNGDRRNMRSSTRTAGTDERHC